MNRSILYHLKFSYFTNTVVMFNMLTDIFFHEIIFAFTQLLIHFLVQSYIVN